MFTKIANPSQNIVKANDNYTSLSHWLKEHVDMFSMSSPNALSGITYEVDGVMGGDDFAFILLRRMSFRETIFQPPR